MTRGADDRPGAGTDGDDTAGDGGQENGRAGSWFGRHQQAAWIAAGASIVVALITALVPVLTSSDDDRPGTSPTVGPSPVPTSGSGSAPTSASVSQQTGTQSPDQSAAPGRELWRGRLVLDAGLKDLDALAPAPAGQSGESDVYKLPDDEIGGWNGTLISAWSRQSPSEPGYQDCSNVLSAEGTNGSQRLAKGTVLCVRTSSGNIARLKVTELVVGESLDYRTAFEAVVWKAG